MYYFVLISVCVCVYLDYPKWYASNTLQLYHHPEWRYAHDNVPDHISKMMYPPA